jgi:tetratricopeptide (TPR) repeat protein
MSPKRPMSQAERDRREAMTLFAAGRAHEQRGEYDQALRLYERALRDDPQADSIAQSIVWLAYHQNQFDVAVRYLKAAKATDDDPALLHRLAMHLLDNEDFAEAAEMLERALAAGGDAKEKEDASLVLLRMELGRLYHLQGKYKKAADNFARVLPVLDHPEKFDLDTDAKKTLRSEPAATYDLIGECLLLADRPKKALAAFQSGNAKAPDAAVLQYNLARVAARTGKPEEALADLEKAFQKPPFPEGTGPYQLLAEVLKKLGREKQLAGRLEKLSAAEPANADLACFLAAQYGQAGQIDKAASLYTATFTKTPSSEALQGLTELYRKNKRADALLGALGDALGGKTLTEPLELVEKAISSDAELARNVVAAARTRLKAGPDKLNYGVRLAAALVALEAKQYAGAEEFFNLAIAARPKEAADLLLIWGMELLMDSRASESAKVFQRGIDQDASAKDNPLYYYYLAGALALSDRTDEALTAARKAETLAAKADKLKSSSPRFASRVPWILQHAKRYGAAITAYEKLVARFDGDHQTRETREVLRDARESLSVLCVQKKRMPEAEEWLEQVLDEFPDDVSAMNDLGFLWADRGKNLDRALIMIEKAVAAEPDNSAYRDSLGWVNFRLGRYAAAVVELKKAAADKDPDAVVLDHLGDALAKTGKLDEARAAWRRSAAAFRKDKDEEKAKLVEEKLKP